MAAQVKAGGTRKTTSARPRPALPPADENVPNLGGDTVHGNAVLRLTSEPEGEEKREPLFYIDDREYTIPVEPPASIALTALDIMASGAPDAAARAERYVMTEMLGEDGWQALRSCKTLTLRDYRRLAQVCSEKVMGQLEEEAPNS